MARTSLVSLFLTFALLAACDDTTASNEAPEQTDTEKPAKENAQTLSQTTREALSEYGLAVVDAHLAGKEAPKAPSIDSDFKYDKVYVTLYTKGQIRGCQSGKTGKLGKDVKKAVLKAIGDKRFGGPMTAEEAGKTDINMTFLHSRTKATPPKPVYEPGIHAIEIRNGDKIAFFKAEVPITKNYTRAKTLKRLCKKAGLAKNCAELPDTEIYTYRALTLHKVRGGQTVEQIRTNPIKDPPLNADTVEKRLKMALGWFKTNVNKDTGLLRYEYFPSPDGYSGDNNHVRQVGSLWSMTALRKRLGGEDPKLDALIKATLDNYLSEKYLNRREGYAFVAVEGKAKLAFNAFLILSLLGAPEYPGADAMMKDLAMGIVHQQQDNGQFATYFESDKNSGVEFYPGEAMLALMKLHKHTGEPVYLETVKKAFPHYRDYWRTTKNTPMLSWHSQTYRLLYEATKDAEVAEHTFEMNDWLIDDHQVTESPWPDVIGGFSKRGRPGISSATYLEGLHDAYAVAKAAGDKARQEKYAKALAAGVRFVMRLQFTEDNGFHLKNRAAAMGGFRNSLTKNNLRNDNTQHAAMMLLKTEETGLLEDLP